jgi:hypothetical protein
MLAEIIASFPRETMSHPYQPFLEHFPEWFSLEPLVSGTERQELEELQALAERTIGWLSEPQGLALYQTARRATGGDVLEIGSFCGKSTIFLALACKYTPAQFFAIDPHKSIPEGGKSSTLPISPLGSRALGTSSARH